MFSTILRVFSIWTAVSTITAWSLSVALAKLSIVPVLQCADRQKARLQAVEHSRHLCGVR
jgi:hypothetical protein